MLAESVRFDDNSRPSHSDQPVPPGGVLKALREAAELSGLDPNAELYNEALRYATEGHLRLARERLNVLLGIDPDDGTARLLLAKVHVAGQRWQEALTALDEAAASGEHVPMDLRRAVEDNLRDEGSAVDDTASLRAREQGETKALRQEARRLRSENAQLVGRCHDLERETRKWAWTTTAVSVIGLVFVAGNLILGIAGGGAAEEVVAEVAAAPIEGAPAAEGAVEAAAVVEAAATPNTPTALADAARQALGTASGLDGTQLAVVVRGSSATLTGQVLTAKQKRRAESVLGSVKGVSAVDAKGVTILARTKGAEHVVGSGDTLSKIAMQYYGEAALAPKIQKANEGLLKGKTDLSIGQKLTIPPVK